MDDRLRGFTIALTLVALAALSVSFLSAAKAKNNKRELISLRAETQRLKQENQSLEASLQQTQQKFVRQEKTERELKDVLAREQLKNQTLTEQLQKTSRATSDDEDKQVKSNIQAR